MNWEWALRIGPNLILSHVTMWKLPLWMKCYEDSRFNCWCLVPRNVLRVNSLLFHFLRHNTHQITAWEIISNKVNFLYPSLCCRCLRHVESLCDLPPHSLRSVAQASESFARYPGIYTAPQPTHPPKFPKIEGTPKPGGTPVLIFPM